jgi:hypothetical protein
MATLSEISTELRRTLAAYPQHAARLDKEQIAMMLEVWQESLMDLPADLLKMAVKNHIERSQWLPSIAEIRASAVSLMRQASPADHDWNEAYAELQRLVLAVGYTGKPEFTNPALAETVRTLGGWQQVCWNEDPEGVFRGQFRDVYQVVIGRMERKVQQSSTVREFIAAMTPQENRLLPEPGEAQDIIRRLADGKRP